MAEAIFDEHPLGQYFEASGDHPQVMPGSTNELGTDYVVDKEHDLPVSFRELSRLLFVLAKEMFDASQSWLSSVGIMHPTAQREFAERFRYDVISSNLLSSSVASSPVSSHARRRSQTPDFDVPGNLVPVVQDRYDGNRKQFVLLSGAFVCLGLIVLWFGWVIMGLMAITLVLFLAQPYVSSTKEDHVAQTFEALETLKNAGDDWDSVVNEALTLLGTEERSGLYYGSPSTMSPFSSSLRVAFHSSLLTTQQQCDNVRQLLSALTAPTELSQLSEMYAPASPTRQAFSLPRPQSMQSLRHERSSSSAERRVSTTWSRADKRSTWNGSRPSLRGIDTRSMPVLNRRTRRRSDLSSVLEPVYIPAGSQSTPSTPAKISLEGVREDDEDDASFDPPTEEFEDTFGSAALHLRRRRRMKGAEAIDLASSISTCTPFSSPSSRFTTMQTPRHSLSLPALHLALQSALASKRYACSYLLALRFDDDDDEGYWENVRSIMTLISSALEDASARLAEALEDAENQKLKDEQPTSPSERSDDPLSRDSSISPVKPSIPLPFTKTHLPKATSSVSFAPAPSSLARFAAHVDVMSSALDDARQHLQECLAELREDATDLDGEASREETAKVRQSAAIQAYERLRRELGLALRECERGRCALSDVFEARNATECPIEDDDPEDDLPPLARDAGSGSSAGSDDKHDLTPLTPPNATVPLHARITSLDHLQFQTTDTGSEFGRDDATSHLLMGATSHHLPPPGIEQVFESDPALVPAFTRERSKLTREERIRLIQARRESVKAPGLASTSTLSDDGGSSRRPHSWGPTGEVVQELKDVIWKVGERRRKLAGAAPIPDDRQPSAPKYTPTESLLIREQSELTHSYNSSFTS